MGIFNDMRALQNTAVDDALALQSDIQAQPAVLTSGTPGRASIP